MKNKDTKSVPWDRKASGTNNCPYKHKTQSKANTKQMTNTTVQINIITFLNHRNESYDLTITSNYFLFLTGLIYMYSY